MFLILILKDDEIGNKDAVERWWHNVGGGGGLNQVNNIKVQEHYITRNNT